jgi:hypothetical protein
MHRLLLILVLLVVVVGAYFYLPIRRHIVYKLGISGDLTHSCCDNPLISHPKGDFEEQASVAIYDSKPIDYPKTSLAQASPMIDTNGDLYVLGTTTSTGEEKWIEVSLKQQKLRAWEGNTIVMEFPISSGLWYPTPPGVYHIYYKTRFQRMAGGSQQYGTYYNLPNVPYNMFFHQGYAIHGAYWHNNFGEPMSHGCVNSPVEMSKALFSWTGPVVPDNINWVKATDENPGTKVFIH